MPDTETVSALCYTTFSCSYLPDRADGEKTKSNCIYTYIYTYKLWLPEKWKTKCLNSSVSSECVQGNLKCQCWVCSMFLLFQSGFTLKYVF